MTAEKRKCAVCRKKYQQWSTTQRVCSTSCAIIMTNRQKSEKAKQQRKADKLKRESFLGRPYWLKKAQAAFNSYVRERDYGEPCISSGRQMNWNKPGGAVDAGHYRSVGSAPHLRFCLWNCNAQSVADNRFLSGSAVDYRLRLIDKIGVEKVEKLEADQRDRRYTIEDLKRIAKIFRKKARLLKKRRM